MAKQKLSPEVLYAAYTQGFFPMPDEESGELRWYRPDPRAIFPLDGFHVSRSLKKKIRQSYFDVTFNKSFKEVMLSCADREETWINAEFLEAYCKLFKHGAASSCEIWFGEKLVGGVYGVHFGGAFFAESMFSKKNDASKIALYYLIERLRKKSFQLLECQFMTEHLKSLGAVEVEDSEYMLMLEDALNCQVIF